MQINARSRVASAYTGRYGVPRGPIDYPYRRRAIASAERDRRVRLVSRRRLARVATRTALPMSVMRHIAAYI